MTLKIEKDAPLTAYNTYCLPGRAAYLVVAESDRDVEEACRFARERGLPQAVLGSGSNVIVRDEGYPGVLIVNRIGGLERLAGNRVRVGAGLPLSDLVEHTASEGLIGLARLAGIPGTVGGALFGNAGAFGVQIGQRVEEISYVGEDCRPAVVPRAACGFAYRTSAFKEGTIAGVITRAVLQLEAGRPAAVRRDIEQTLSEREGKHPPGASCGSYFKNLAVEELDAPPANELSGWIVHGRIPAGRLIEAAGGKGLRVGGAYVSQQHGNFLLNDGSASAADLRALAEIVKTRVWEQFGVRLEEEVRYL